MPARCHAVYDPAALCNRNPMLVLSRKVGQKILVGDQVTITVVRIANGSVRIGIEAPAETPVIREELAREMGIADQEPKR